jgi:branched-chain amino acid transport system ATP-binding protein
MALLEAIDAHVHFGGVRALDGATVTVEEGELMGLIGPNGSGKSTLIAAISRLTNLTSGTLNVGGRDYTRVPAHVVPTLGIARTFQTVRLIPTISVLANVMLGAGGPAMRRSPVTNWLRVDLARSAEHRAREVAYAALDRVGIAELAHAYPRYLPYGSQRRVEIARALASNPELLLLDEPMNGMHYADRDDLGELLLRLKAEGLTLVFVEHDMQMIHRLCSHVTVLNFGKVIAEGSPAEVSADSLVREAYLGRQAEAELEAEIETRRGDRR